MKIDELISELEQVKEEHGNVEVNNYCEYGENKRILFEDGIQIWVPRQD